MSDTEDYEIVTSSSESDTEEQVEVIKSSKKKGGAWRNLNKQKPPASKKQRKEQERFQEEVQKAREADREPFDAFKLGRKENVSSAFNTFKMMVKTGDWSEVVNASTGPSKESIETRAAYWIHKCSSKNVLEGAIELLGFQFLNNTTSKQSKFLSSKAEKALKLGNFDRAKTNSPNTLKSFLRVADIRYTIINQFGWRENPIGLAEQWEFEGEPEILVQAIQNSIWDGLHPKGNRPLRKMDPENLFNMFVRMRLRWVNWVSDEKADVVARYVDAYRHRHITFLPKKKNALVEKKVRSLLRKSTDVPDVGFNADGEVWADDSKLESTDEDEDYHRTDADDTDEERKSEGSDDGEKKGKKKKKQKALKSSSSSSSRIQENLKKEEKKAAEKFKREQEKKKKAEEERIAREKQNAGKKKALDLRTLGIKTQKGGSVSTIIRGGANKGKGGTDTDGGSTLDEESEEEEGGVTGVDTDLTDNEGSTDMVKIAIQGFNAKLNDYYKRKEAAWEKEIPGYTSMEKSLKESSIVEFTQSGKKPTPAEVRSLQTKIAKVKAQRQQLMDKEKRDAKGDKVVDTKMI